MHGRNKIYGKKVGIPTQSFYSSLHIFHRPRSAYTHTYINDEQWTHA